MYWLIWRKVLCNTLSFTLHQWSEDDQIISIHPAVIRNTIRTSSIWQCITATLVDLHSDDNLITIMERRINKNTGIYPVLLFHLTIILPLPVGSLSRYRSILSRNLHDGGTWQTRVVRYDTELQVPQILLISDGVMPSTANSWNVWLSEHQML